MVNTMARCTNRAARGTELHFENVSLRCEDKLILKCASGRFDSSRFVGILGPSGSGKTTLLNVLSGYDVHGTGDIFLDGTNRNELQGKVCQSYIAHKSDLQILLTVEESLKYAADFKLGVGVERREKNHIIKSILEKLDLENVEKTLVSKISGGEQKRLSIALELINYPPLLFLDEPNTGLDISSSSHCLELLKNVAKQGTTVICTIHQATASNLRLFDLVYVLSEGNCLYQGSPDNLLPFLETMDMRCPTFHNPADYVMDIAIGYYGEEIIDEMIIKNASDFKNSIQAASKIENSNKIVSKKKISNSYGYEFKTILHREYIKMTRNLTLTYLRLMASVMQCLLMVMLFWKVGSDGEKVWFNYNAVLSYTMHMTAPSLLLTVLTFPTEIKALKWERFNRWYSLETFYAALTIIDVPISIIYCVVSTLMFYYFTDQPMEWFRFAMFSTLGFLICIVTQSIGLLIGSMCDVVHGIFVASGVGILTMIFGGFGIMQRDLPSYMRGFSQFSYLKYGVEGLVGSVSGYNRTRLACPHDDFCMYSYSDKFMRDMGIEGNRFWTDVFVLLGMFLFFKVAAFFALKRKIVTARY